MIITPAEIPDVQLFAASSFPHIMVSGWKSDLNLEVLISSMAPGSRSTYSDRGTYFPEPVSEKNVDGSLSSLCPSSTRRPSGCTRQLFRKPLPVIERTHAHAMLESVKFPCESARAVSRQTHCKPEVLTASVANLHSCLPDMEGDDFTHVSGVWEEKLHLKRRRADQGARRPRPL